MKRNSYSSRAPKKINIVTFFAMLICNVKMTCTGKSIKARSVSMLIPPIACQNDTYIDAN